MDKGTAVLGLLQGVERGFDAYRQGKQIGIEQEKLAIQKRLADQQIEQEALKRQAAEAPDPLKELQRKKLEAEIGFIEGKTKSLAPKPVVVKAESKGLLNAQPGLLEKPSKPEFKKLDVPEQKAALSLTEKTVSKVNIKNQIDAALDSLRNPNVPEEQKIVAGQNLLKTLNSTEGADAVGAEESKRLSSFLEYKLFNFTQPGSFMGRDLDKFTEQVALKSKDLERAIGENQRIVEDLKSGKSFSEAAIAKKPEAQGLKLGQIDSGYRYIGGDPADQKSWEKVK